MLYLSEEKLLEIARYFVENESTVRILEQNFSVPRSTIHKRLRQFADSSHVIAEEKWLAYEVYSLLEKNKQERHIRGGNMTRQIYMQKRLNKK